MGPFQFVIGTVVTLVVYSLILFGVFKVFQIAGEVSEIKDLLRDIKRNTQDVHPQSPESLMRAYSPSAAVETSIEPS